jgi:hypothetical protein
MKLPLDNTFEKPGKRALLATFCHTQASTSQIQKKMRRQFFQMNLQSINNGINQANDWRRI